ncbi:MAG: glycosyltransferase family 4 protein [Roseateles sp.]|uniref:glycosyltransferase family 4 protein n=1 Tax=Roseateles sp. TaxID=1971397 RepID=UPI004035A4D3
MHIVHVEDFFHPDAGYQVNLLSRLQVAQGHRCTIVTAELDKMPTFLTSFFGKDNMTERDARFERETGVRIIRLPLLTFYSGRAIFSPRRLLKTVSGLKPDVAFVHSEDTMTGMLFIWMSRWLSYPMILDCHMLEMASENRFKHQFRAFYQRFVTPIILGRNIPLIRVVDSDYVQKCLGIPLSYTDLLSFGTDTSYFSPNAEVRRETRTRLGLSQDAYVVLYAGKLDASKGGKFLAETLKDKFPRAAGREIELLVVGTGDGAYGEEVERTLAASGNKLVRLPTQRYYDLAQYYCCADLAIFPKQCSMSFFEAQSCGLPVLFEDNEINVQRIEADNAFVFKPGDLADFRAKIMEIASLPPDRAAAVSANARNYVLQHYDYVPIARQFTAVLERAVSAWKRPVPA